MKENAKWKSDNLEAFKKHIELVDLHNKKNEQHVKKIRSISVLSHKDLVFYNTEDLYKYMLNSKGLLTIMTGERGLYTFYNFLETNLDINVNNITFIINPEFDRRTEGYISHPNGGIYKSYEYHIYTLNY